MVVINLEFWFLDDRTTVWKNHWDRKTRRNYCINNNIKWCAVNPIHILIRIEVYWGSSSSSRKIIPMPIKNHLSFYHMSYIPNIFGILDGFILSYWRLTTPTNAYTHLNPFDSQSFIFTLFSFSFSSFSFSSFSFPLQCLPQPQPPHSTTTFIGPSNAFATNGTPPPPTTNASQTASPLYRFIWNNCKPNTNCPIRQWNTCCAHKGWIWWPAKHTDDRPWRRCCVLRGFEWRWRMRSWLGRRSGVWKWYEWR